MKKEVRRRRGGEELFWSLDNAPRDLKALGNLRLYSFLTAAVGRLLLGPTCIALAIAFAVVANGPDTLPSLLKAPLKGIQSIAVICGVLLGILNICGGVITSLLLSRYYKSLPPGRLYKYAIWNERCQLLVGLFFVGFLWIPAAVLKSQFCNITLLHPSDAAGIYLANKVCSDGVGLSASLFAFSFVLVALSFIPTTAGFQGFFLTYGCISYSKYFLATLCNGFAAYALIILVTSKDSSLYQPPTLDGDPRKQVDYFYLLIICDALILGLLTLPGALLDAWTCWRRSQVLMGITGIIQFTLIWFQIAATCSLFWTFDLRGLFCNFNQRTGYPDTPLTNQICDEMVMICLFYIIAVGVVLLDGANVVLAVISFFGYRPLEWPKRTERLQQHPKTE